MAGRSFSLTEKLAVTGAFLAMVAMAVGTEDDPGLVIAGQETIKDLGPTTSRLTSPPSLAVPQNNVGPTVSEAPPLQSPPPPPAENSTTDLSPPVDEAGVDQDGQFTPELGRVPRDFSNGPPDS